MNEKRSDVEKFINETLPDQVRAACQDLTPEIARQHRSFIFSHVHSFFPGIMRQGILCPFAGIQQSRSTPSPIMVKRCSFTGKQGSVLHQNRGVFLKLCVPGREVYDSVPDGAG